LLPFVFYIQEITTGVGMTNDMKKVEQIIRKRQKGPGALVSILQDIQEIYNYLPQESLELVAETMGIPLIDVCGTATFYKAFSLTPRGKHLVTVCMGTACHVRGGPWIVDELERKLDIYAGETTEDDQFTLETVNCLGACALGPIMVVDKKYYGQVTIKKVGEILKKYGYIDKKKVAKVA
jgi:NADH:ubiquinone oxidoreductase subunit E